jgi:hypothetical protein
MKIGAADFTASVAGLPIIQSAQWNMNHKSNDWLSNTLDSLMTASYENNHKTK